MSVLQLVGAMLMSELIFNIGGNDDNKTEREAKKASFQDELKKTKAEKKERSVLLRAKLLQMRESAKVTDFARTFGA